MAFALSHPIQILDHYPKCNHRSDENPISSECPFFSDCQLTGKRHSLEIRVQLLDVIFCSCSMSTRLD